MFERRSASEMCHLQLIAFNLHCYITSWRILTAFGCCGYIPHPWHFGCREQNCLQCRTCSLQINYLSFQSLTDSGSLVECILCRLFNAILKLFLAFLILFPSAFFIAFFESDQMSTLVQPFPFSNFLPSPFSSQLQLKIFLKYLL